VPATRRGEQWWHSGCHVAYREGFCSHPTSASRPPCLVEAGKACVGSGYVPAALPAAPQVFGSDRQVTWGCGSLGSAHDWHSHPGSPLLPWGAHLLVRTGVGGRQSRAVLASPPLTQDLGPQLSPRRTLALGALVAGWRGSHGGCARVRVPAQPRPSCLDVPVLLHTGKQQAGASPRGSGVGTTGL